MPETVGRVAELWRYPVKSMRGETLDRIQCNLRGFDGDRRWAVRAADGKLGSGKSSRRFHSMRGLLSMAASLDAAGATWIRFPEGAALRAEDPAAARRVAQVVGEPAELVEEAEVPHFDQAPLHLLSTSSLAWLSDLRPGDAVDRRRFRPNLVLATDGPARVEESWRGRELEIGEVRLRVEDPTSRCVMITLGQDELPFAPGLLRELEEQTGLRMGVYGRVLREGVLQVGDDVTLDP